MRKLYVVWIFQILFTNQKWFLSKNSSIYGTEECSIQGVTICNWDGNALKLNHVDVNPNQKEILLHGLKINQPIYLSSMVSLDKPENLSTIRFTQKITLTPKGHHRLASSHHPCLHRWEHTQNRGGDPLIDSHSIHLGWEHCESCIDLKLTLKSSNQFIPKGEKATFLSLEEEITTSIVI